MVISIQVVSLFFGIWFTFVNVAKAAHSSNVYWQNLAVMSAAWAAFITVTWLT